MNIIIANKLITVCKYHKIKNGLIYELICSNHKRTNSFLKLFCCYIFAIYLPSDYCCWSYSYSSGGVAIISESMEESQLIRREMSGIGMCYSLSFAARVSEFFFYIEGSAGPLGFRLPLLLYLLRFSVALLAELLFTPFLFDGLSLPESPWPPISLYLL